MTILVTGGAGYIGSHIVHLLRDLGRRCVVLDDLSRGFPEAVPGDVPLVVGGIQDRDLVRRTIREHGIIAAMHLAASVAIPDSLRDPLATFRNNTCNTLAFLEACLSAGVRKVIFSSSAAVYGASSAGAIVESAPTLPINPYGWSKLMAEALVEGLGANSTLGYVMLRYFNVAGSDPWLRTGLRHKDGAHLITVAAEVAAGRRQYLPIYGTDYPTKDGTCVRDFVHVWDISNLHVRALDYLLGERPSAVLNCGYGRGSSVLDVVQAFEGILGEKLSVRPQGRRDGDAPVVVANADKARALLGWEPQLDRLESIVESTRAWERSRHAASRRP